jgi:enoyl-[acyl-carrier protein] reductase/trans-2-enoyl-CoA reductase (NAD+)
MRYAAARTDGVEANMSEQVVAPRIRGFISLTAHPEGCAVNVRDQVEIARRGSSGELGNALVIGSSTGYGLASFLVTAFGYGASTLGVCFEKEPGDSKTGTAGWYNLVEAHRLAEDAGVHVETINGDAFSDEVKREVVRALRDRFGPLDTLVYSLAAPRRRDPDGTIWNSVLKPIGEPYTGKAFDLRKHEVIEATIEPATPEEIEATRRVMGGDDWRNWVELLHEEGLLAKGCRVVAYSYIGPEVTAPLYRHGTIGRAKEDLEATAIELNELLGSDLGGGAWVSVNKGVVTQASSAIPGVPLYLSLLFKTMKEREIHEGPIEQIVRLFADHIGPGQIPTLDAEQRIRLDDLEMREDVQREVRERWDLISTDALDELTDYAGYRHYFEQLFGFAVDGVDYSQPTEVDRQLPQPVPS